MTQRMIYIANIRLPTERAHGLQIIQNSESFANIGLDVSLWVARRFNTPALQNKNPFDYYGVKQNFRLRHLPTIDLLPLVPDRTDWIAKLIFYLQLWTFTLSSFIGAIFTPADIYYSRDPLPLLALSLIKPRQKLVYEAHRLMKKGNGEKLQRLLLKRVGVVVAVTETLQQDLIARGADPARIITAHDGIRAGRFANIPSQADARAQIGWSEEAFIVGYVGRLQTMAMDKGLSTLVDALRRVKGAHLAIVGGPDEMAEHLRQRWRAAGMDDAHFLYAGHIQPDQVPHYLSAFDVCVMPFPYNEHFARHASPLKLFEYMAARKPVVASDLPALAEVVRDGVSALLVPPSDIEALANAIQRLHDQPELREFLGDSAYRRVMSRYTWDARAKLVIDHINKHAQGQA